MKAVKFGDTSPLGTRKGTKGGSAHATANRAPEMIRQSTTPMDSSKPGGPREWPRTSQSMMARNRWGAKRPDPEQPEPLFGFMI